MLWFLFALLTAVSTSLVGVVSKINILRNTDEYTIAFSLRFFSLVILIPLLFVVDIPLLGKEFWLAMLGSVGLNIIATLLYLRAIKSADLSLVIPLLAFTPLFLLVTSPLIIHETPSILGGMGVLLIVAGSYILNLKEKKDGFFAPFKVLLREKGPRLMLGVAFIWSITSALDKIWVIHSSPIVGLTIFNGISAIIFFFFLLFTSRVNWGQFRLNFKHLFPLGIFTALENIFQMIAISIGLVPYVISVKRTSVVMSAFWGHFLFKEPGFQQRIMGSVIMVGGVILIVLA